MVRNYKIVKDILFPNKECKKVESQYNNCIKKGNIKKCIEIKNRFEDCTSKKKLISS